jgi:ankyrin repeat protein
MAKHKETLLELCKRTMLLGNSISVRILEYFSTIRDIEHGFKELATDFVELSRTLWAIEAGLSEASQTRNRIPNDMTSELQLKIQKTNDDFSVLNQMCLKFLEYENKGALGRFQRGFRLMFSGTDIDKMRHTLQKNRESLKMSAMVFRWSVGDTKADSNAGIGYTGLVAALERMNNTMPTTAIPQLSSSPSSETFVDRAPQLPPVTISDKSMLGSTHLPRYDSLNPVPDRALPPLSDEQTSLHRYPSVLSSNPPSNRSAGLRHDSDRGQIHVQHTSTFSDATVASTILLDPALRYSNLGKWSIKDFPLPRGTAWSGATSNTTLADSMPVHNPSEFKYPTKFVRIKADPSVVPHWTPRPGPGVTLPNSRASLLHAIQHKDRNTVEKLLDVGADASDPNLLIRACLNGDEEIVRLLLLFGADSNGIDANGYTPLFAATKTSLLEGVELLMKYGADPNLSAGPDGETPLVVAINERNFELTHLLLMYGADASAVMSCGNTPLIKVINKTVPAKFVELILDYDTDADAKNREGTTPLFMAIQSARVDIMSLLLDHGANPNMPGPKHPLWPSTYHPEALQLLLSRGADTKKAPGSMELAASLKSIDSISILLNAGVSPNIKKDGIYTPLCSAIRDNSVNIVDLLLANGADPNLPASEYPHFKCITHNRIHILPKLVAAGSDLHEPKGILETAVVHNNMEALKYLLSQGVHLDDRSDEGCTALTTAIRDNRMQMLDLLLANGADPNVRGEDWPLTMAVKRPEILKKLLKVVHNPSSVRGVVEAAVMANQLESIKMLLKAGVSVEDKTGGVFSPLTTALREDRNDLVRFLLYEAGADPNAPGEHLPIIKAIRRCRKNDTECIEMLLDKGADINKMYRGWNAILQAVESGNIKILKLLLQEGNCVDLMVKDESGRTVGEIVKERGWSEAIPLLFPDEY